MSQLESAPSQHRHIETQASGSSNVFSEFFVSLYESGIKTPVRSLKQLVGVDSKSDGHEERPALHGSMKVAEALGDATGQFLDLAILSKCSGRLLQGAHVEKVIGDGALNRSLSAAAAGLVHGGLLTPVDQEQHEGFMRRVANGVVEGVAFGTVGGTGARLEGRFGNTFMGRAKANVISGAAGGAVDGIMNPLTHGVAPTVEGVLSNAGSWAVGNAAIGGLHEPLKLKTPVRVQEAAAKFFETPVEGQVPIGVLGKPVTFRAYSDRVEFDKPYMIHYGSVGGRAFPIDGARSIRVTPDHGGRLYNTPESIEGVGSFEYKPHSTIMTTPEGTYEHDHVYDTLKFTTHKGQPFERYELNPSGSYSAYRRPYTVEFDADGRATSAIDSPGSGNWWTFHNDGSISMRSQPSGKYRIEIDADGNGAYRELYGSSRAVGGRVRSMNHLPLTGETNTVSLNTETNKVAGYQLPDRTPADEAVLERLRAAREVLRKLALPI